MIEPTNEFEKNVLQQMKENCKEFKVRETCMTRFLMARDWDLVEGEKTFRQSMKWRAENDIDNHLSWEYPPYLMKEYPWRLTQTDYFGGPICWLFLGKWDVRPHIQAGRGDDIVKWVYHIMESALQCIHDIKDGQYQGNLIMDLDELSFQQTYIGSLKILYSCLRDMERNYPEFFKRLIILNAPWYFSGPFNFVKGLASPHTLRKIKVFGQNKNEWMNYLLEIIPKESLPEEYFEDENGN